MKDEYDQSLGLAISQSQDELFRSAQPILLRNESSHQTMMVKTSPQRHEADPSTPNSPVKLMNKNSTV